MVIILSLNNMTNLPKQFYSNYVLPVRRIGTEIRSGPVQSAVSDRSRADLGPDRFDKKISTARTFQKESLDRRNRFCPRIVKIGAILAIFEPFEVWKIRVPFFGEFGQSSQDLGDSDYNSIKSRDDRLNSPKSGIWIFRPFRTQFGSRKV